MKVKKHKLVMKITLPIILGLLVGSSLFFLHKENVSDAADARLFNASNIMSDFVMTDKNSLTEAQIQSFLNSKVTCDHWGTKWSELGEGTRAQYAQNRGWVLPFQCLNTYTQDGETATHIIWQAAQDYNVNPQVLIVLLQKEQSLVTDEWPGPHQYRSATGYGCPDTAPCDSEYYGFKNQVRNAAKFFNAYQTGNTAWYKLVWPDDSYTGVWRQFTYNMKWHPDSSCGTSPVWIENRATASLYSYTPYRPNDAALAAGYGLSGNYCSSYGNRNFYLYFTDWFGDPSMSVSGPIGERYHAIGGVSNLGKQTSRQICGLKNDGCYQTFQYGVIYWTEATGAWETRGGIYGRYREVGLEHGPYGYPTSGEICGLKNGGCYQQFEHGRVYWSPASNAYDIRGPIQDRWSKLGAEKSFMGYPTSGETCGLKNGGCYQVFQNGSIYWTPETNAYDVHGGILAHYFKVKLENGKMGYPTSGETCGLKNGGCYQVFQNGSIYWTPVLNGIETYGEIEDRWMKIGSENGFYGYPTSGIICGLVRDGCYQVFQNGVIYYSPGSGAWNVHGGIREHYRSIGSEWGKAGYPISGENSAGDGMVRQDFEKGSIYWTAARGAWFVAK